MHATETPRARRNPTLALALTALSALAIAPRPAAQVVAWAYVSRYQAQQVGVSTPSAFYEYHAGSGSITMLRYGRGAWEVRIPQRGAGQLGILHASAYGGNHSMVVESGREIRLQRRLHTAYLVRAFAPSGQPVDAGFTVRFQYGGGDREAYAFVDCPSCPRSSARASQSFNGARGTPDVVRTGTGSYTVTFPGLGNAGGARGGHAQVTAAGTSFRRAKVLSWGPAGADLQVRVLTTSPAGYPADSKFHVSFFDRAPILPGAHGYTWVDNPWASGSFPHPYYTDSNGTQGSSRPIAVQRVGIGSYVVHFPRLNPMHTNAQVTVYGGGGAYAAIDSWLPDVAGWGTYVSIKVFDAAGRATDGRFTLLYSTKLTTLL